MSAAIRSASTADGEAESRHSGIALSILKNVWYVAGWSSEFQSGAPSARTIANEVLVFYRKGNGELVAMEDRCPHRWGPLSLGRVEGDALRCMYHGVKYGPDGACIDVPGQDHPAKALQVRTYPVIERHLFAWVWTGDAELADPRLIPDLSKLDDPWRRVYTGSLDYEANFALINDNLLDLSHISFLHEKTLGRPVSYVSDGSVKPTIPSGAGAKPIDRGVRVENWVSGAHSRSVFLPRNTPDGELYARIDFVVPGIYISEGRMYPHGTAAAHDGLAPPAEIAALSDGISFQAVTPMTDRTSRYFYSIGHRASDLDQAEAEEMWSIVLEAFQEDLVFIQRQQKIIDEYPGRRMGGIAADRGLTLFRSLMNKLAAEEASLAKR